MKLVCCEICRFSRSRHYSHILRFAQFSKVQTKEMSCLCLGQISSSLMLIIYIDKELYYFDYFSLECSYNHD